MSEFRDGSVFKNNQELLRRCQNGYIMYPHELPRCSVAAIARLAKAVGGSVPDCADPDCDHPKLRDFSGGLKTGMSIARAICLIEEDCEGRDANGVGGGI